jgi:hypothetical protein
MVPTDKTYTTPFLNPPEIISTEPPQTHGMTKLNSTTGANQLSAPEPDISLKSSGRDLKKSDSDLLPIPKDKILLLLNMIPLETTKANLLKMY